MLPHRPKLRVSSVGSRMIDHFRGLDERRRRLTNLEFKVPGSVAGNNGGDGLPAHVQHHLGQQTNGLQLDERPTS